MNFLRRLPLSRLLLLCGVLIAVGTGVAVAAAGGSKPPRKALASALHDALTAPAVQGVSADITLTNRLLTSAALSSTGSGAPGAPSSALVNGGDGRVWISQDGRARLELKSSRGDTEIYYDGTTVSMFDAASGTLYKLALPQGSSDTAKPAEPKTHNGPPSVANIQSWLSKVGADALISAAHPTNVAGQPAYRVSVTPSKPGGLIAGAQLAWDAAHGVPLDVAVFSRSSAAPVLELKATNVTFGAVDGSVFKVPTPTRTVDVNGSANGSTPTGQAARDHPQPATAKKAQHPITGLAAVQAAAPFPVSAPAALAGLPQHEVRLLQTGDSPTVVVSYGTGLGSIAVIERKAPTDAAAPAAPAQAPNGQSDHGGAPSLPKVSINGNQGSILATALGTLVHYDRAGVSLTVLGSVTDSVAKAAAAGL